MRILSRVLCICPLLWIVTCAALIAGATGVPSAPLRLWSGQAPLAKGDAAEDIPTLTPFLLPPSGTGEPRAAVIICPGGGYKGLSWASEGLNYARWLNELGINAFILRYRLGGNGYRHPVMQTDVARAVRYVRANALQYGIDPNRIGVIGSSAGGHLASTILTLFDEGDPTASDPVDRVSSRPTLGMLIYPVIALDGPYAHTLSAQRLLGETPDPELTDMLSTERRVHKGTPPTFLVHSRQDTAVVSMNSLLFAEALERNKIPYELHIYDLGAHGFALGSGGKWDSEYRHPWVAECQRWLIQQGFTAQP